MQLIESKYTTVTYWMEREQYIKSEKKDLTYWNEASFLKNMDIPS